MAEDRLPFRAEEAALIRFGDAGRAPVLSYNVPQPAEYNGRDYLELPLADAVWSDAARPRPQPPGQTAGKPPAGRPARPGAVSIADVNRVVADVVAKIGKDAAPGPPPVAPRGARPPLFDRLAARAGGAPAAAAAGRATLARPAHLRRLDDLVRRVGEAHLVEKIGAGKARVIERRTLDGRIRYDLAEPRPASAKPPRPRLAIVHLCRMSSFLGDYGAGRTIGTFSLLPGERHEVEIKTYRRSKTTEAEASSVLDSFEETTAEEFQEDLTAESSSQNTEDENFAFEAEAEASATWGWGKGSASAGVSGGSASHREEFAKNVASTTQKHAATAAAKRQVEVNTSSETQVEEGEETAIRRTIENINVGRTLNFVFRQMNQVFVTVLHVVDVRMAFRNGDPAMDREVALPELGGFLEQTVKAEHRQAVRAAVWQALEESFDWQGDHRPLAEAVRLGPRAGKGGLAVVPAGDPFGDGAFWRSKRQEARLDPLRDGADVTVPGVVLGVTRSTLPTDGVIVEALLGQGNALDAYAMGLQAEAVRERAAANDRAQAELELARQKVEAVAKGDKERVELLARLTPAPKEGGGAGG